MPSDHFDPDEVFPQNSPLMKPYIPNIKPSDPPLSVPIPLIQPSHGDAVLIHHLGGGRNPEISQEAGDNPLDEGCEDSYESVTESDDESDLEDGIRSHDMSPAPSMARLPKPTVEPATSTPATASGSGSIAVNLQSLASKVVAAVEASQSTNTDDRRESVHEESKTPGGCTLDSPGSVADGMRDRSHSVQSGRPVLAPPMSSPYPIRHSIEMYSPRQQHSSQVLMHPNIRSPTHISADGHGELAPLQMASPKSDTSNQEVLPSIRSQLYEQLQQSPKDASIRAGSQFPHSPPAPPSRLGSISSSHASPPVSPNDVYRVAIPSPPNTLPASSPYANTQPPINDNRPTIFDFNPSAGKLERPTISSILTPPSNDKMSIDNMTNPQVVGNFVCKVQGCNAQPFQTQYLLNSHANVHSSNRPHYCSVKGCPRSEGGKGFKRKNEMIRHGLVHESPGYVCPFCPDREHKYPRPDNLQRHVRVHHVDKDKDDPALRDVLAQRPDGPSRGRRRRGVA